MGGQGESCRPGQRKANSGGVARPSIYQAFSCQTVHGSKGQNQRQHLAESSAEVTVQMDKPHYSVPGKRARFNQLRVTTDPGRRQSTYASSCPVPFPADVTNPSQHPFQPRPQNSLLSPRQPQPVDQISLSGGRRRGPNGSSTEAEWLRSQSCPLPPGACWALLSEAVPLGHPNPIPTSSLGTPPPARWWTCLKLSQSLANIICKRSGSSAHR